MDLDDAREQNLLTELLWAASHGEHFSALDGKCVMIANWMKVPMLVLRYLLKEFRVVSLVEYEKRRLRTVEKLFNSPISE